MIALLIGAAFDRPASALPGGTIAILAKQVDHKASTFEKDVKKGMTSALTKSGEGWHLYFVAYLNKAAGATEVNIVFYDLTAGKEQVNAFPVGTQTSAKIIMSDLELHPDQGFKVDHTYEARITRLIGGKEVVYAKAKVELKK